MKVEVFAILKDYFKKEFEVDSQTDTIADLRQYLTNLNPAATYLLNQCRFAIHDEFVELSKELTGVDKVVIVPPSSGG